MSKAARILLIVGLALVLGGPLIGIGMSVAGMVASFHTLGQNGVTDPSQLAGHIGNTLIATSVGIMVAIVGLPVLIVAIVLIVVGRRDRLRMAESGPLSTTPPPSP